MFILERQTVQCCVSRTVFYPQDPGESLSQGQQQDYQNCLEWLIHHKD